MIVALAGLPSKLDSVRNQILSGSNVLTMNQLVNNYCTWLPLMLLDRFVPHPPLNHVLLLPTITVVVDELENGVDIVMVFVVTVAIVTVTLKLIVVQRQENNDNHESLSLLNRILLKTLPFPPLITMISFNLKNPSTIIICRCCSVE